MVAIHPRPLVSLSKLVDLDIADADGHYASLRDLAGQLDQDAPTVTRLLVDDGARVREIAADGLRLTEDRTELRVDDLHAVPAGRPRPHARHFRLVHDVLDRLVLDLRSRGPARVNDVFLAFEDVGLQVKAVDTTARGILRRLTRGRWPGIAESHLREWRYVVFLHGTPHRPNDSATCRRIARLPAGEIGRLSSALPYLHAAELIGLLPARTGAEVLAVLDGPRQLQVFEELDDAYAAQLLETLAPDTAADLLARLEAEAAREHLRRLPARRRRLVMELLQYPEDSVGAIMTNDVVMLPQNTTVADACRRLHDSLVTPAFVYYAYVVDTLEAGRLCGMVTLRELLTAEGEADLQEIMNPYLAVLDPLAPLGPACQEVIDNRVQALPVVDDTGRLLGAVTADAALAQIAPSSLRSRTRHVFS